MGALGQVGGITQAIAVTPSKPNLYAITGAATTYSIGDIAVIIDGKQYQKAAATGEATPTTDSASTKLSDGTAAGLSLATGYGTVVVWGVNLSGTVTVYRGETVALDAGNAFTKAPAFPAVPDTVAPIAYTTHRNYSGSAFVVGTTNWNTGSTVHATQACAYLPGRPQIS